MCLKGVLCCAVLCRAVLCHVCVLQIIECSFDMERKVWMFMRERTDKDSANHRSVFDKVMTSIKDNITVSQQLQRLHAASFLHITKSRRSPTQGDPIGPGACSIILWCLQPWCCLLQASDLACTTARMHWVRGTAAHAVSVLVVCPPGVCVLQQEELLEVFDEALKLPIYSEEQQWLSGTHPSQLGQQERQQQQQPQQLPQEQQQQLADAADGGPHDTTAGKHV